MSSAQEAETGSGITNGKDSVPFCNYLHEMVHIQGPTPIQFDTIVSNCTITGTFLQCISKAMDMYLYCLHDQCQQK